MRSWLAAIAALILCVAEPGGAADGPIDCGPAPTVKCLSVAIFSLARTLPDDSRLRESVGFAQLELAPGNIKTALEYLVTDKPDPSPWEDIEWIAKAGRFDRAIERATDQDLPVERLGGLLAVAASMLDNNDRTGATRIADIVERELPAMAADERGSYAGVLSRMAAEIRVRLGQTERAVRLLGQSGDESLEALLSLAGKYPAATGLREQAWREAERIDELRAWWLLLEDAKSRGDKADLWRAAQHASGRMDAEIGDGEVDSAMSVARLLMEVGWPDLPARLTRQWTRWVQGKEATRQSSIVNGLMPLLVGLALDQEVRRAADAVSSLADRSECLSRAAEEYFRIGRNEVARTFDAEALRVALSSPTGDPELQRAHDGALHNLALARAGQGDIQGALDVAARLGDERRVRSVTSSIVRRAIDNGHGPGAGPAIQAMERQAGAAQDASLLLQAVNDWHELGEEENARRSLVQALKMAENRQAALAGSEAGVAAELMWRINSHGEAQALLDIAERLQVNDPGAVDRLVEVMRSVSPAAAVRLTGRQVEIERRIEELAGIAIHLAEARK
jgi:hypothetical protein